MAAFTVKRFPRPIRSGGLIGLAFATMTLAAAPPVPQTMRAIRTDGSAPGAVKLETVPVPQPGAGQVLLRVYAAGTNPVDWAIRAPTPGGSPAAAAPPQRAAAPPGRDVAGVIVALGSGVSGYQVGDKVYTALAGGAPMPNMPWHLPPNLP